MATLQVLKAAYSDVARIQFSKIPASDLTKIQDLVQKVDSATLTLTQARAEIGKLVAASTSVANIAYAFFTGATPGLGGLDYLVSPTGSNPNNLNSAYYQSFSAENRYINFSVNLGKTGAGQTKFAAAYGGLDLTAATTKAYTDIFGFAPAAGKIDEILNGLVSNGAGGTFTRAQYFATYGGDGATGIGTKAAMVGWLLNEAVKADLGPYAKANDAFLADLAADGQAAFNVDLLGVYGPQPTFAAGATIAVTTTQSVSLDAATATLQSTNNNDTVNGVDSNASQSIATGNGNDVITLSGTVGAYVDGGDGNDTINLGTLNASVPVLGGAPNGTVSGGNGNDAITINRVLNGAVIDGGAGDDTLTIGLDGDLFDKLKITNVEHLAFNYAKIAFGGQTLGLDVSGYTGLRDITMRSSDPLVLNTIASGVALKMDGVTAGGLTANYRADLIFTGGTTSTKVGASSVDVYVSGTTNNNAASPTKLTVTNNDGPLNLHVQSDSALDVVSSMKADGATTSPIVVTGTGRLTAAFETSVLDASGAAGITVTRIGYLPSGHAVAAILSGGDDKVYADLRVGGFQTYTLGAGSDTFSLYQDRFGNLKVDGGIVAAYATITDFAKGIDHVDLGGSIASVVGNLNIGSPISLEQALITASGQIAANGTGVFEYNGDTYIYHQDSTVGVNSGDGLIRLVGVTGLSIGTGAAPADIHYG